VGLENSPASTQQQPFPLPFAAIGRFALLQAFASGKQPLPICISHLPFAKNAKPPLAKATQPPMAFACSNSLQRIGKAATKSQPLKGRVPQALGLSPL
jgi:hypothetical protein